MAKHIFYEKLLNKELVLNFLTNYNRNMLGYCSHNSREQMKNPETFSNEAQPDFLIEIVFLVMTNTKDGIFRYFHHYLEILAPSVRKGFSKSKKINVLQNFTCLSWKVTT